MPPLSVILNACSTAMRRMTNESSSDWHVDYCAVVDPASVLEMAMVIKSLLEYVEANEGGNKITKAIKSKGIASAGTSAIHDLKERGLNSSSYP